MASSLNKVLLMGNITRDIELKTIPSGTAVAQIGLAMNRKWKDASGEAKEEVCFVDCEAWGKTAELISQYFAKGRPIMVEGRLKLDQWDDKESGQKRSKIKVVIENFYFVDSKATGESAAPPAAKPAAKSGWSARAPVAAAPVSDPDDIPFSPEPGYRIW